jgi:hypothetical protein
LPASRGGCGDVFGSVDECVSAAFDEGIERISQAVADAAERERGWRARVRAGLEALLAFLDAQPRWARFLILESPVAPVSLTERRQRALAETARVLERETRGKLADAANFAPSSRLTAELVIGGVFSVLQAQLLDANAGSFTELAPSLMTFVVAPYQRVARGGAEQEHLPVRSTYRTMRVLEAIGTLPRSNNREIAEAAGLRDQGQTSKLLNRLARRGLVHNAGLGAAHGEPNAWLLTVAGKRILEAASHAHALDQRGARSPVAGSVA